MLRFAMLGALVCGLLAAPAVHERAEHALREPQDMEQQMRAPHAVQPFLHSLWGHRLRAVDVHNKATTIGDLRDLLGAGTCDPTDPLFGCDMKGNACTLCGPPLPGRGYDGQVTYTSAIQHPLHDLPSKPDYVMRDDCGSKANSFETSKPLSDLIKNTTAYPGYTNAWCELNLQVFAADGPANHDWFFQAKALTVPPGFNYDFWYCKYNGFLTLAARQAAAAGFASLSQYAQSFCAATATRFDIESYSLDDFLATYDPTSSPNFMPTPEQAHSLGAWLCAMGGTGGLKGARSNGPGSDIAYCVVCAPCRPARTPPTGPRREPAASSRDTRPWTRASRPPWLPLPVLPRSRL